MKHGDKVKQKILDAGLTIWPDVSPSAVARAADLNSHAAVLYHFPRPKLKDAIAAHAVKSGCSKVIVHLISIGHKAVKDMTTAERNKHFKLASTNRLS
jgi:hypothetical protein